jgi:hypothetical protein
MTTASQAPAPLPWPPVSLEDLRSISAREHASARAIIARVQALIAWRGESHARLDPSTDLPAGDWRPGNETNDYLDAVRHIAAADYDTINHLRWYTNTLVGMKLIHFCPNPGMRSVMPLPQNVRETVAGNLHRLQDLLGMYLRMKSNLPPRLLIDPPWMLGEVGAAVDGVIVNQDTVRQQVTVALLWRHGVLDYLIRRAAENGTAHVVEVGAGHGSLCYHLKRLIPQLTYTIIDLPEVLVFSGVYLALTAPEWGPTVAEPRLGPTFRPFGICLVPNFQFGQALSRLPSVDLAVNISSFGEMTPWQVCRYAAGLSAAMGDGGVVFESNDEGQPEVNASVAGIFAKHFQFNARAFAPGFPPFEGTPRLHSNQPQESMLVPVEPFPEAAGSWRRC